LKIALFLWFYTELSVPKDPTKIKVVMILFKTLFYSFVQWILRAFNEAVYDLQHWIELPNKKQNKTKQNKTKNKKQNKTKQNEDVFELWRQILQQKFFQTWNNFLPFFYFSSAFLFREVIDQLFAKGKRLLKSDSIIKQFNERVNQLKMFDYIWYWVTMNSN
jgi:hypothetical protein